MHSHHDRRAGKERRSGEDRRQQALKLAQRADGYSWDFEDEAADGQVVERVVEVGGDAVQLSMNFRCSETFAREVLDDLVGVLENRTRKLTSNGNGGTEEAAESQPEAEKDAAAEPGKAMVASRERRPLSRLLLALVCVASAAALVGIAWLSLHQYRQEKMALRAKSEQLRAQQQTVEARLRADVDLLLERLEQLAAIPGFAAAFPEVGPMAAVAKYKRGPEAWDRARAVRDFLRTVAANFSTWERYQEDFPPALRPSATAIASFHEIWRQTEPVLARVESLLAGWPANPAFPR